MYDLRFHRVIFGLQHINMSVINFRVHLVVAQYNMVERLSPLGSLAALLRQRLAGRLCGWETCVV